MRFINHIEIPAGNKLLRKGDVHVYSKADIQQLCDASALKLELYEVRKGFRLHCVVRKPDYIELQNKWKFLRIKEAFQSVLFVRFILCYILLQVFFPYYYLYESL